MPTPTETNQDLLDAWEALERVKQVDPSELCARVTRVQDWQRQHMHGINQGLYLDESLTLTITRPSDPRTVIVLHKDAKPASVSERLLEHRIEEVNQLFRNACCRTATA